MCDSLSLSHWVERLKEARVLVVGDVMLDRFVYGEVSRISPEAPVPVLREAEMKSFLGGAGNVVRNLKALGCRVALVSVVGEDPEGKEISQMLSSLSGVDASLVVEPSRRTTVKTRFMAGGQQVLRVDTESTYPIGRDTGEEVKKAIQGFLDCCDVVVLSDYAKGLLGAEILNFAISQAKDEGKAIFVDPKGSDYTRYRGASVLTPNLAELGQATGCLVDGDEGVVAAARKLIDLCGLDALLATRGREGMTLVSAAGEVMHLRAEAREVFDVSGAGDTVIAVLGAAQGIGVPLSGAAALANIAAGIVVGKVGTAVVRPQELLRAIHQQQASRAESKVMDLPSAVEMVAVWRRKGYRIGFTNGVFDLLHPGHLSLLSRAAGTCDRLIVGLNGDLSVRRIKGQAPVQNEGARSAIVASLEHVHLVVIFQEETPISLLEALRPDVLIKGGNYRLEEVVGADVVKAYGGEVVLAELADIYKTNSRIAKITNGTL
ncbi:MAG: D-glycero-beta-D-manno-heptose-7-phosphate kinase [Rhodocyclaceae bacterium]|nr:D-glycero-beta-D-manno-heptose-7-phosphate kinase [Rhodocyclaceae bacterium]